MGYDNGDTDCKYANVCSFSPRCRAKKEEDVNCYEKDNRTFLQKMFLSVNYEELKKEFENKVGG